MTSRSAPGSSLLGVAVALALAAGVAAVATRWANDRVVQVTEVVTESMAPTMLPGERVLVAAVDAEHDLGRGDLVVLDRPPGATAGAAAQLVKRVVAVAGDTVESRDGAVVVNGEPLAEPYLPDGAVTEGIAPTTVPPRFVYVLGDDRTRSADSREFGPVSVDLVLGRAVAVVWPAGAARELE